MCIFCDIVEGKIPSYKIYEDDSVYAFLDISKEVIGHTLVIPKKHYENIFDIPSEMYMKVMNAVKLISEHYRNNCGISGVNIMNASGVDAEQSVFHLHFHILPRFEGDGHHTWPKIEKNDVEFEEVQQKFKIN